MTDREAMQMALEALKLPSMKTQQMLLQRDEAITALRAKLEQPEQEPAANDDEVICPACCHQFRAIPPKVQQLMLNVGFEPPFTAPPQRQPLTHEQRFDLLTEFEAYRHSWHALGILIDMVEAAHGIKKTP